MSANNWSPCPQCFKKPDDMRKVAQSLYGKVSAAEYDKLLEEAEDAKPTNMTSLREDWEIGIYKGRFLVDYGAHCALCGFEFTYKHEEPFK